MKRTLVFSVILSLAVVSNLYAQDNFGACTDVTMAEAGLNGNPTTAELGVPGIEDMQVRDQVDYLARAYDPNTAAMALSWCNNGHSWVKTVWWGVIGHEIEWTVNGHARVTSKSWNRLDHYWHTSQQWVRDGHDVPVSVDWARHNHQITLSQRWPSGHNTNWSYDGHSDMISQNWQDVGHAYDVSMRRRSVGTKSRAELWQPQTIVADAIADY
ncbi:MAG: hypothetical protein EBZ48_09330 [Proteobacteria bacterium]|nr:hypothetical protein [Pseudomonadota bacterium]